MNENEQKLKDKKSSENLSEDTHFNRVGNPSEGNNMQINKNSNKFINQNML